MFQDFRCNYDGKEDNCTNNKDDNHYENNSIYSWNNVEIFLDEIGYIWRNACLLAIRAGASRIPLKDRKYVS